MRNAPLLLALLFATESAAQVVPPPVFQGRLSGAEGPVSGEIDVVFELYDADVGGELFYRQETRVTAVDGRFSLPLGDDPAQLAAALGPRPLWWQVTVDGETLTPRTAVGSAPYSIRAASSAVADDARTLDGQTPQALTARVDEAWEIAYFGEEVGLPADTVQGAIDWLAAFTRRVAEQSVAIEPGAHLALGDDGVLDVQERWADVDGDQLSGAFTIQNGSLSLLGGHGLFINGPDAGPDTSRLYFDPQDRGGLRLDVRGRNVFTAREQGDSSLFIFTGTVTIQENVGVTGQVVVGGSANVEGDVDARRFRGAGTAAAWAVRRPNNNRGLVNNMEIWTDLPGLTITFQLESSALVTLHAQGVQRSWGGDDARCHQGYRFVVDGTGRGDALWGQTIVVSSGVHSWWSPWNLLDSVTLPGGEHTVRVQTVNYGGRPGNCAVCGETNRTTPGYTQCHLAVQAFYREP